jgi:hypothetical protein
MKPGPGQRDTEQHHRLDPQIEQLDRSKVKSKHESSAPNRYRYVQIPGKAEWRPLLIDRA